MSGFTQIIYFGQEKDFFIWLCSLVLFLAGFKLFKSILLVLLTWLYQFFIQQNKLEL
jgi:hypothetical protein